MWEALASSAANAILGDRSAKRDFSRQAHHAEAQSAKQMAFQKEMSNTSYQRVMADMKKAGLNPILAGKLGGASTPSGAMAKTPKIDTAQAISTMANAKNMMAQAELSEKNAEYFRGKSFGPAVLNARPTNILLTELLERNPAIIEKLSDIIEKTIQVSNNPMGMLKALLGGDFGMFVDEPSNAKTISDTTDKNFKPYKFPSIKKDKSIITSILNKIFDKSSFLRGKRYNLGDIFK